MSRVHQALIFPSNIVMGGYAFGSIITSMTVVTGDRIARSSAGRMSAACSTRMPSHPHARAIAAWSTGAS
jgi:hypothetical protein